MKSTIIIHKSDKWPKHRTDNLNNNRAENTSKSRQKVRTITEKNKKNAQKCSGNTNKTLQRKHENTEHIKANTTELITHKWN